MSSSSGNIVIMLKTPFTTNHLEHLLHETMSKWHGTSTELSSAYSHHSFLSCLLLFSIRRGGRRVPLFKKSFFLKMTETFKNLFLNHIIFLSENRNSSSYTSSVQPPPDSETREERSRKTSHIFITFSMEIPPRTSSWWSESRNNNICLMGVLLLLHLHNSRV